MNPIEPQPFASQADWRAWLAEHHASSAGVWLQLGKKGSPLPSVTYAEALDEALCFGWIDSVKRSHDEHSFLQRFSPRRPGSLWSKVNREHVARLEAAGRMQPAGAAMVEEARRNGQWEAAYDSPKTMEVPPDFQAALDASPGAAAFFATLKGSNRYSVLHRVVTAKKPETRTRRIATLVEMLERGETFH